jgi:transposase
MKAIHGGKKKDDKIDSDKIATLLRSVPGIGKVLALVILYEIHQIRRFRSAGEFLSYARLISGRGSSAGKPKGVMGRKIGNAHLKWAFSEAAVLMIRESDQAKRFVERLERKHGKPHAASRGTVYERRCGPTTRPRYTDVPDLDAFDWTPGRCRMTGNVW